MDNIKKIISPLFRGITEMELEQMNTAGYLRQKEYEKNHTREEFIRLIGKII